MEEKRRLLFFFPHITNKNVNDGQNDAFFGKVNGQNCMDFLVDDIPLSHAELHSHRLKFIIFNAAAAAALFLLSLFGNSAEDFVKCSSIVVWSLNVGDIFHHYS